MGWRAGRRKEGQSDGPPAHAHVSLFCFVLSGPRLHLWQKESRKPNKVSPPGSRMGPLNSPRVGEGGPVSSVMICGEDQERL